jgi:hypothetical protein
MLKQTSISEVNAAMRLRNSAWNSVSVSKPAVIQNVPLSTSLHTIINAIRHFSSGSNDHIDTATWGATVKNRPLIIINNLPFESATQEALQVEVGPGLRHVFEVTEFNPVIHSRTDRTLLSSFSADHSAPGRARERWKRTYEEKRDSPPRKFAKGIADAIALQKSLEDYDFFLPPRKPATQPAARQSSHPPPQTDLTSVDSPSCSVDDDLEQDHKHDTDAPPSPAYNTSPDHDATAPSQSQEHNADSSGGFPGLSPLNSAAETQVEARKTRSSSCLSPPQVTPQPPSILDQLKQAKEYQGKTVRFSSSAKNSSKVSRNDDVISNFDSPGSGRGRHREMVPSSGADAQVSATLRSSGEDYVPESPPQECAQQEELLGEEAGTPNPSNSSPPISPTPEFRSKPDAPIAARLSRPGRGTHSQSRSSGAIGRGKKKGNVAATDPPLNAR